jgi:beta-glucanase (GH16 family)
MASTPFFSIRVYRYGRYSVSAKVANEQGRLPATVFRIDAGAKSAGACAGHSDADWLKNQCTPDAARSLA